MINHLQDQKIFNRITNDGDKKFIIEYFQTDPSLISSTDFLRIHRILLILLSESALDRDEVNTSWKKAYTKIYDYVPGIYNVIRQSIFKDQLTTWDNINLVISCIFFRKKSVFFLKTFILFLYSLSKRFHSKLKLLLLFFLYGKRLRIEKKFSIGKYSQIIVDHISSSITIKNNVRIGNYTTLKADGTGKIIINDNVFINNYCSINALALIEIGADTIIGEGVRFYDHNHLYTRNSERISIMNNDYTKKPIFIGKNCWISSNVVILSGVRIGNNCIIGANNLIYDNIPDNSIVISKQEKILK